MSLVTSPSSHYSSTSRRSSEQIPTLISGLNSYYSRWEAYREEQVKKTQDGFRLKIFVKIKSTAKPEKQKDTSPLANSCLRIVDDHKIEVIDTESQNKQSYNFDHVFFEKSHKKLFQTTTIPLIENYLMGQSSALFVYGQPCSGKTHALGISEKLTEDSHGLIPASLRYLFDCFEKIQASQQNNYRWKLNLNLMQIHLDNVTDLLDSTWTSIRRILKFQKDKPQSFTNLKIERLNQALSAINIALSQDRVSAQSQGHLIFKLHLTQEFTDTSGKRTKLNSQLTIVDLACSQDSSSASVNIQEAWAINASLVSLNKVIMSINDNALGSSVPYESSTLTQTLKDVLASDCQIAMIGTISSCSSRAKETTSTLQYLKGYYSTTSKRQIKESNEEKNSIKEQSGPKQEIIEKFITSVRRNTVKNKEAQIQKQLMEYLFKLVVKIRKTLFEKIPGVFVLREKLVAEMIHDLKSKIEVDGENIDPQEAQLYLKRQEILEIIDQKYPIRPERIPDDEEEIDEDLLQSQSLEATLEDIEKAEKFMVSGIEALAENSISLEKMRLEMLNKEMNQLKLEAEIQQITKLVEGLLKYNTILYTEVVNLRCPYASSSKKTQIIDDHTQSLMPLLNDYINAEDDSMPLLLMGHFDLPLPIPRTCQSIQTSLQDIPEKPLVENLSPVYITEFLSTATQTVSLPTETLPETKSVSAQTSPRDNYIKRLNSDTEDLKSVDRKNSKLSHRFSFGFEEVSFRRRGTSHVTVKTAKSNSSLKEEKEHSKLVEEPEGGSDSEEFKILVEEKSDMQEKDVPSFLKDEHDLSQNIKKEGEEESPELGPSSWKDMEGSVGKSSFSNIKLHKMFSQMASPIFSNGPEELKLFDQINLDDAINHSIDKNLLLEPMEIKDMVESQTKEDQEQEDLDQVQLQPTTLFPANNYALGLLIPPPLLDSRKSSGIEGELDHNKSSDQSKDKELLSPPFLKNNISYTEEKSRIIVRDVNMTNFTMDIPSLSFTSGRELLELKKLTTNKARNFDKVSILEEKNPRGRQLERPSIMDSMSPKELRTSIERVNPSKYTPPERSLSRQDKSDRSVEKTSIELSPSRLKELYEDEESTDPYVEYLVDTYKARKRSPISEYKVKNKVVKFNDKPPLPKVTKVVESSSTKRPKSPKKDQIRKNYKAKTSLLRDKSSDRSVSSRRDEKSLDRSKSSIKARSLDRSNGNLEP